MSSGPIRSSPWNSSAFRRSARRCGSSKYSFATRYFLPKNSSFRRRLLISPTSLPVMIDLFRDSHKGLRNENRPLLKRNEKALLYSRIAQFVLFVNRRSYPKQTFLLTRSLYFFSSIYLTFPSKKTILLLYKYIGCKVIH